MVQAFTLRSNRCSRSQKYAPGRFSPTRNGYNHLRSQLWGLILHVLDEGLGIKPTVNDATRDNSKENSLLCGCDYMAKAWDEANIKYATVRDNNDLKKLRETPENFAYTSIFLNQWLKIAQLKNEHIKELEALNET